MSKDDTGTVDDAQRCGQHDRQRRLHRQEHQDPQGRRPHPPEPRHVHRQHRSPPGCTTSSTRSSTTPSTRPSPATASNIHVAIHVDGSVSVADDGRGIPVGVKPDTGKSTLEEALTVAGIGGKFDNAAYRVSAGLHGMGAKAMTALSEWAEAEVRRNGRVYKMEFERGYATSELKDIGPAPAGQTGTTITFKPDPEIFRDLTFDYDTLADRFRELAFLNKGLAITLTDERDGKTETFQLRGRHRRVRRLPERRARQVEHAADLHRARSRTVETARRPRRGRAAVHRRRGRARARATPTTPSTPTAARTSPASAPA